MYVYESKTYACALLSLEAGSVLNLELRWWPMRSRDPLLPSAGVKGVCIALPNFLGARDLNPCCRADAASAHTLRAIAQPLLFLSVFGLFHLTWCLLIPLPKNDLNAVFYCRCITQTRSIIYVSNLCLAHFSVDLHIGLTLYRRYWQLCPRMGVPGYHGGMLTSFPSDVISRRYTAGTCGSSSFRYLRDLCPDCHSGCSNLYSPPIVYDFPLPPLPVLVRLCFCC